MGKLGIMGGTFNPVHNAHLVIAQSALEEYGLDRVMFLPNNVPPHKTCDYTADAAERLEMVRCAIAGNDSFFVSDYEIAEGGLSYTVDTLRHFSRVFPEDSLYFIIGGDSLRDFPAWRMPEEIASLCTLLAYPRDGLDMTAYADGLRERYGASVSFIHAPRLDISSSDIRRRCGEGRAIRYLVPDSVREIIEKHGIYVK